MSGLNTDPAEKYRNNFLKEVMDNVEQGEMIKSCIQCGICAGSCPMQPHWEHSPQKILMLITTNQRQAVLNSDAMWMCTSCYNCMVRCPSGVPIIHIMHGLANYSKRLGLTPKNQPTAKFSELFWNNLTQTGRINEVKLSIDLFFMNGFKAGVKTALAHQQIGKSLLKTKRMAASQIWGGDGIKDKTGFQAMLKKAYEIESEQIETNSQ